jgi:ribosomal protein S18 acetylase RimI-like enzyme
MVLFIYDLPILHMTSSTSDWPNHLRVERKQSQEEIGQEDLQRILNFWNPRLARRSLTERFNEGATLWLIRSEGQLAGYGWTLTGRTMRPHYVPLGANDVHLFDFLVYPEYRGRRINPSLVTHILDQLSREGRSRAYIEVAEWNHAELTSLRRTAFQFFGVARKMSLSKWTIVEWGRDQANPDQKTRGSLRG